MLAINGGKPIWTRKWPQWPMANEKAINKVIEVLKSERWAISGPSIGAPSQEKQFAEVFANYCGVKYCVPTCNGSSALLIALEALNIGKGNEVIAPILTWVATVTAITNVNALPVFVDVDPNTLCISPDEVRSVISSRTKAIIPVHLYSTMADMDALLKISAEYDIPLIEDSSHVHGARWEGSPAGSLGAIGAFSMQQTKVLTVGEGGAAVTNDENLARRMEQLRADGRIYNKGSFIQGKMDLIELGEIQGSNYCLSEFQAALLIENLKVLDHQHELRQKNANILDKLVTEIDGVTPLSVDPHVNKRVFYKYVLKIDPECFANRNSVAISKSLSFELGINIEPIYKPLHQNPLYNPLSKKRFTISKEYIRRLDTKNMHFPHAEKAYSTFITMPHNVLLGNYEHLQAIAEALEKIKKYSETIQTQHKNDKI